MANRTDAAIRSDFFLIQNGDISNPYPSTGYVTIGLDLTGVLNASYVMKQKYPEPGAGNPDVTFMPSDTNDTVMKFTNNANYVLAKTTEENTWVCALPSYSCVSFFNANNFGIKMVIGPFYRWGKNYMPLDLEKLDEFAASTVNSGALVYGAANGPVAQVMNYANVQMTREQIQTRYAFSKIHPVYFKRIRVIRKYFSVLMPPNARYDFKVKIPGMRSVPLPILKVDWNRKYRYTQTCFFYKAMSGTMFDQNNAVVTDYGAGPGWAITHQKPSVCAHVHQTTPLKYKVMQPPWYIVNNNPRVGTRNVPNLVFNAQPIVEQKVDNAVF